MSNPLYVSIEEDVRVPISAYFTCLEFGDLAGLRDVLTEEATGTWRPHGEVNLEGIDAIVAHLSSVAALTSATFVPSPAVIHVDGTSASARHRVVAHLTDERALTLACAEYSDELRIQADGAWRIAHRDHHELWRASVPLNE